MRNPLISFTEIYTEMSLIPRIITIFLLSLPFIGIGYGLKVWFDSLGWDTYWNLGVIALYALPPFLLFFGLMILLTKLSNSLRKRKRDEMLKEE